MTETVLLYDAYSLIYRAFFAIRVLTGPDGAPVQRHVCRTDQNAQEMAVTDVSSHSCTSGV